jgi:preprotein translocase subunit SecA
MIMLQILDKEWLRHLQDMDHLKEGIGLRSYAQQDPLKEYKKDAFELFQGLDSRINEEILLTFSRIQIRRERPEELSPQKRRAMQLSHGDAAVRTEPIKRASQKIGRNDLCPCGSGKKYKKCCGVNE